jgi:hypothetical protein
MEYSIWHCRECYNVYHFRCVKVWSESASRNQTVRTLLALPKWKCPSCSVECHDPKPTCWCGKHTFGVRDASSGRPNACLNICDRVGVCSHGAAKSCHKPCHPGPCKINCSAACDGLPVVPKSPTCWSRLCTRVREREQGSIRTLVFYFMTVAIIYGLFGVLLSYHIRWWTKPFKYPLFSTFNGKFEVVCLILGGNLVLAGVAVLLVQLFNGTSHILISTLNLDSVETKRSRKIVTKFFGGLFLAAFFFAIFALPFLG